MKAPHRVLGGLTIMRVLEMVTPFKWQHFFPETTAEDWAPHRQWLEPDALDPDTDQLQFPM